MIFDNANSSNSETLTGGEKPYDITFCETPLDDRNQQMSLLLFHSMAPSSHWEESVFLDPEISTPRKLFICFARENVSPIWGFVCCQLAFTPVQLREGFARGFASRDGGKEKDFRIRKT